MIAQKLNDITRISENEDLNCENYLDALHYIDHLYVLERTIGKIISKFDPPVKFLPSFKGRELSAKMGIPSTDGENELRSFILKSDKFAFEDSFFIDIKDACSGVAESVTSDNDKIIIILKRK